MPNCPPRPLQPPRPPRTALTPYLPPARGNTSYLILDGVSPPFDLCGDLDDDDIDEPVTAVPKDHRLPAAAPTPNGLNDHLLRFTRILQRPTQNPNPSPNLPPPPPPGTVRPSLLSSLFFLALQST
jgi:hypothetical protein